MIFFIGLELKKRIGVCRMVIIILLWSFLEDFREVKRNLWVWMKVSINDELMR